MKIGSIQVVADKQKGEVLNPRTNQIINPIKKFDKSQWDKY